MVNIKKKFGDFLLNVDFEADKEILGVLGASGCGKSLTLKCIAGIVEPDEGRIELDGRVLYDSTKGINLPPQQRKVGYLFQNYALFPNMTVEKNIGCGLGKRGNSEIISEYIRRFQLKGLEKRYPSQLSGGQQQRVALARIFASQPELLMLDEPFSALDSYLKWQLEQEMMNILKDYKGAVLFVSHNRDEVYRLCNRIVVMDNGKSERPCTKHELFQFPKTLAATILSGCKNISRAKKISHHSLRALDWNIVLHTEEQVKDSITHVAIRANHLEMGKTKGENTFSFPVANTIEEMFNQVLIFDTGHKPLRFEFSKSESPYEKQTLLINLPKEKLILF
ncbi:ATP-binding cassette domain-containing protein [Irregularibacter muris]|jgi:molybdate transport system ATP-binding protein|uniref:ATP-binding cassette domain-containing protein n=1 Tax=Irregularibacter muris TaxID=1796619 RepID=A0AAE3L0A2_9FIRM|nr:ATP-binding cassette domain-containing protein [Irregularibacter muris]MCR1899567.1 ATP-binding cassette domain-containing protein [Irregularibacter muris]